MWSAGEHPNSKTNNATTIAIHFKKLWWIKSKFWEDWKTCWWTWKILWEMLKTIYIEEKGWKTYNPPHPISILFYVFWGFAMTWFRAPANSAYVVGNFPGPIFFWTRFCNQDVLGRRQKIRSNNTLGPIDIVHPAGWRPCRLRSHGQRSSVSWHFLVGWSQHLPRLRCLVKNGMTAVWYLAIAYTKKPPAMMMNYDYTTPWN